VISEEQVVRVLLGTMPERAWQGSAANLPRSPPPRTAASAVGAFFDREGLGPLSGAPDATHAASDGPPGQSQGKGRGKEGEEEEEEPEGMSFALFEWAVCVVAYETMDAATRRNATSVDPEVRPCAPHPEAFASPCTQHPVASLCYVSPHHDDVPTRRKSRAWWRSWSRPSPRPWRPV